MVCYVVGGEFFSSSPFTAKHKKQARRQARQHESFLGTRDFLLMITDSGLGVGWYASAWIRSGWFPTWGVKYRSGFISFLRGGGSTLIIQQIESGEEYRQGEKREKKKRKKYTLFETITTNFTKKEDEYLIRSCTKLPLLHYFLPVCLLYVFKPSK